MSALSPEALAHGLDMLDLYARASEGCALDAEYGGGPWFRRGPDPDAAERHAANASHLRACAAALRTLAAPAREEGLGHLFPEAVLGEAA
jgi:hypothetical protein